MTSDRRYKEQIEWGLSIEELGLASNSSEHSCKEKDPEDHLNHESRPHDDRQEQPQIRLEEIGKICLQMKTIAEALIVPGVKNFNTAMEALQHEFREKIKRDTCKEKIIDNLHQELQQYRDNFIKSNLKSIIMDIIKIVDDIRKLVDYHRSEEPSQHDIPKLISHLEGISADLEDICLWHGVERFNSEKGQFNPVRQKILKQIETSQAEKDKCVAEQLRPGYLWEGRVLRPEMVSVYVYREAAPDSIDFEKRTSDEQAD